MNAFKNYIFYISTICVKLIIANPFTHINKFVHTMASNTNKIVAKS